MSPKNGRRFWIGFLISFVLFEAGYRAYLYHHYVVDVFFPVTTQDNPVRFGYFDTPNAFHGPFQPGVNTFTRYNQSGERFSQIRIEVNNLGWRSRFDYAVEKKPLEYRIAVIGDSITASTTNDQPWPDLLQDELNADPLLLQRLNATSITVFNISTPGATFSRLANTLTDIAKRLNADHLVVNFPIDSLPRRGGDLEPVSSRSWKAGPESPAPAENPEIEIDGVKVSLWACPVPRKLENPGCRINPSWIVPKGTELSKDDVNSLKHELALRIVRARVIATVKPLFLYEFMGKPIIPRTEAQAAGGGAANDPAASINHAVDAFSIIREIYPDAQIVHAPMYWYLYPETNPAKTMLATLTDAARERGIEIVDATKYMPLQGGKDEWYRWYNLPNDGHFSDYGAAIYAKAMHKVISEDLLGSHATD
jgi:lysophospholipase L1-like esterase